MLSGLITKKVLNLDIIPNESNVSCEVYVFPEGLTGEPSCCAYPISIESYFLIIFCIKKGGPFRLGHMQDILVISHYYCQSCFPLEIGSDCLSRVSFS